MIRFLAFGRGEGEFILLVAVDLGFVGEVEGAREAKWEVGDDGIENTEFVDISRLGENKWECRLGLRDLRVLKAVKGEAGARSVKKGNSPGSSSTVCENMLFEDEVLGSWPKGRVSWTSMASSSPFAPRSSSSSTEG